MSAGLAAPARGLRERIGAMVRERPVGGAAVHGPVLKFERSLSRAPKLACAGAGETFAIGRADGATPLPIYGQIPEFTLVRWENSSITR